MRKSPPLRLRFHIGVLGLLLASATACTHSGKNAPLGVSSYQLPADSSAAKRLATAQLCETQAGKIRDDEPAKALGLYLQAAKATLDAAVAGDPDARALYNRSVAASAELAFIVRDGVSKTITAPGPDGDWQISVEVPQYKLDPLNRIDSLAAADSIKVVNKKKNLRSSTTQEGIGGALVAYQQATPERIEKHPYRLPIGTTLPVTAVADFTGKDRARLRIYDTMLADDVTLSGRKLPLAANYTAALVKLMAYAPTKDVGFDAMKHPEDYLKDTGIFMIEPFRPGKIPVLLVHGLKSQPATWRNTYNELIADPVIRKNYQFWFYRYPTGFPIGYTSRLLRSHLDNAHEWASKNGGGSELNQLVLVGHSMGSVISSFQIRDSKGILEKEFLIKRIDELDVDDKTKEVLRELLDLRPPKYVTRAILVAGPHRGSKLATGIIGMVGNLLIDLSKKITTLSFLDADSRPILDFLTASGRSIVTSPADGIRSLRPHNPALMEIVKLPVGNNITYHSIIGNQGKDGPLEDSSDSVVEYWSSHLEGAASEKIVPSKHDAHNHPEGIAEIRRILHEHLKKLGRL